MNIWKSIAGMQEVELTSAVPEAALEAINAAGIEMLRLQQISELTCRFHIRRKDHVRLQRLCKKRGETLKFVGKTGIYWAVRSLLARPVLLAGMGAVIAAVLWIPTRVFFVEVEGNTMVPSRRILEAAENCGICFGASRREVRSEKVKNALLSAVPELQWAGVNTSGCVATVSVRERSDTEAAEEENIVSNIVAARDGYILSGTVVQGNAVFQVGQTVKTGQLLISGYTDCGICIRATRSEGEIIAQTSRELEAVSPASCQVRGEIREVKKKISVLYRKKRINLWKDSGISDSSCGRMYKEYYITLPGGFQLPFAVCVETYVFCDTQTADISQTNAEAGLTAFADRYLIQNMVAGEVRKKLEAVDLEDGLYRLTGRYICTEMIGREQREQIGDTNGKDS